MNLSLRKILTAILPLPEGEGRGEGEFCRARFIERRCVPLRTPCRATARRRRAHSALRNGFTPRHPSPVTGHFFYGFTLIELMIVVAIMGIIMTISVPMAYKVWHKAPMRQAIKDVEEVFTAARRRAIMQGQMAEVVLHPRERRMEVVGASGSGSSARLGDHVYIDLLDINMSGHEYRDDEIVRVRFYPNGTADELKMVLHFEAEQLGIEVELTTGLTSVVSDPLYAWAKR